MTAKEMFSIINRIAPDMSLCALDVGARSGVDNGLKDIAPIIDFYGFEPDPAECDRLQSEERSLPWKSISYLPTALYNEETELTLNLYRQRGCSSVREAETEKARLFGRDDYYELDDRITIPATSLDRLIEKERLKSPHFVKIDVQGLEDKCFEGARSALEKTVLGVRTEVSFFQTYKGQPFFADIDELLRSYDLYPMRFLELHEWRRTTKVKYPHIAKNAIPFSRGQMIHGYILYLKHPEAIADKDETDTFNMLVRLALLSLCYHHYDHAVSCLNHPAVRRKLTDEDRRLTQNEISTLSLNHAGLRSRLISFLAKILKFRPL